jgi:hypothetical protein
MLIIEKRMAIFGAPVRDCGGRVEISFYKKFMKMGNDSRMTRRADEMVHWGEEAANANRRSVICSHLRSTITALGLAGFLLISAAPLFSTVAPPMRRNAPIAMTAAANDAASLADRMAAVEQKAVDAQAAGDNAWMLMSSALVLLMTGPGLALFYGGLVRKKNILGTMIQSFALMALITVLWAIFGYSLCFAPAIRLSGAWTTRFCVTSAVRQIPHMRRPSRRRLLWSSS